MGSFFPNKDWISQEFMTVMTSFLGKFVRLGGNHFNEVNARCVICDMPIPAESIYLSGIPKSLAIPRELPRALLHYVEIHGHKPTAEQIQAVDIAYQERLKYEREVRCKC